MTHGPKSSTCLLVAFLSGASLAALSIAASAQTLSGEQTVTQTFSADDLNVATDATFSVTTLTGSAIDLSSTNSLIFTDNYQSVINGLDSGIYAVNYGTGALSITSTGTVTATGVSSGGIQAENYGTDLTVTSNNVTGGLYGLWALNDGNGALSITSTGTVTAISAGGNGIYAQNGSTGNNFTVTTNNVTADFYGIIASNYGAGALSITSAGTVTSISRLGIFAQNFSTGTNLTVTANNVTSVGYGIYGDNRGTGALSITSTGTVSTTGTNGYGIFALNRSTGTNVTVNSNTVTGVGSGIYATNYGTGALSITSTGTATATGVSSRGIYALSSPTGTNLTVTANNVTGVAFGIFGDNRGTGALSITSTGTVSATGTNGYGIYALSSHTGTNLTVTANNVTGVAYGIFGDNRGTGALSITSTGTVSATGTNGYGIFAVNKTRAISLTVSGTVTGGSYSDGYGNAAAGVDAVSGIYVDSSSGSNAINLLSTAVVNSTSGRAITASGNTSITFNAGSVVTGAIGFNGNLTLNTLTGSAQTLTRLIELSSDLVGSGEYVIGTVTKSGAGTLILTGANTYTGGTTISAGTLQIGSGSTTGSIGGNVTNNATLVFNRSDSVTFAGIVSGTGSLTQSGTGTLTLTGANTYTGGTTLTGGLINFTALNNLGTGNFTINGGGLQWGAGTVLDVSARLNPLGTLGGTFDTNGNAVTLASVISGPGALTKSGVGTLTLTGANTYTGGTTVAVGTLSLGSNTAAGIGTITTTGSVIDYANGIAVANAIVINSNMTQLQTLAGVSATQSGVISETGGARPLEKIGAGTLILTGANTYTGGTTISAGTLQIGSGSTTGSIGGNVTNNATLVFNRSDSVTFAGIVSGTGSLTQSGTGTLTLTGTNTYTGGTTIRAGTLAVTGKIGAVTVTSGTLQGTGTVGTTTIASGSTLSPGINGAPGTLNVSGNLTMAAGGNYAVAVTPTAASKAIVSGSANVNGAVTASFAAGNYTVGQKFAIVESTGLVTGTFASLTNAGLPAYLTDNLSYTSNSVYLNLATKNLTPLLPTGSASNLTNTATAIDAAVTTGGIPSTGMLALYGQIGATLGTSLTQAQGQVGTNLATSVTQSFAPFLKAMMAQGTPGQGATSRVWGTVYGGHTGISANVTTGATSLSGSNVGLAVGGQKNAADGSGVFGGSIAIGQQTFSSGNGTGISQDLMLGAYATKTVMDRGYISASLGYGILNVTTTRTLTVSGTDILSGKVNAQEFGGRVEGGYHFSVDDQFGLTPYLAGSLQKIVMPAYVETAQSGTSSFALSYLSQKNTFGRTEAGTHLDRSFQLDDGSSLSAQGTIGWSHQLGYNPTSTVSFQPLSGSSFLLNGIKPANDTAVLGLNLQAQKTTGLSYGVRLDSQVGAGTTILQATGNVAYRW